MKGRIVESIAAGYGCLVAGDFQGGENRMAVQLDLLRSLGIPVVPRGDATRR